LKSNFPDIFSSETTGRRGLLVNREIFRQLEERFPELSTIHCVGSVEIPFFRQILT